MKKFNLKLNKGQELRICTWYDTVSPESAENGDYESTGRALRNSYCDNIKEAAEEIICWLSNHSIDSGSKIERGEVAYSVDADIDYNSGFKSYDRLCIVAEPFLDAAQQHALKALLNKSGLY
jgi:hypothetical protein